MKRDISRRDFLKILGAGIATTALATTGCGQVAERKINGAMTYRTGKRGDRVSLLGFGCMRWPTLDNKSVRENGGEIDQEMVNRLVDVAIENGVNYFDTSPAYCQGLSERVTGIALKRHERSKYFIATKLSNFPPETWSREESMKMYKNSFSELQVDYIDYMLLHSVGGGGMDVLQKRYLDNGMLDFLLEEREAGRIRNLGFSYHGDIEVFDYLLSQNDKYQWDFVQIQLNYFDWFHAKEINDRNTNAEYLYGELNKYNISAIIMEPLLGGRLSNVPMGIAKRLKERRPEDSVASWAFRYAGSFSNVLTVLSGMTYMDHLEDNLKTYSPLEPFTDGEFEFIYHIADEMLQYKTIPCNDCQYCMPCPYGIDIPTILTHYNKCINESQMALSTQDPNFRALRRRFLVGYERAVDKYRQADHCISCGKCVSHCPQNINIPAELTKINDYVEMIKRG